MLRTAKIGAAPQAQIIHEGPLIGFCDKIFGIFKFSHCRILLFWHFCENSMIYARSADCWQNGVQLVSLCLDRSRSAKGADHNVNSPCLFSIFDVVKNKRINNERCSKIGRQLGDVKFINVESR